jgi:hypothetical protein
MSQKSFLISEQTVKKTDRNINQIVSMRHTKGPWSFRKQSSFNGYYIEAGDSFIGETGGGIMPDSEMLANTKIVAAAPEMLETLQNIVEYWNAPQANQSLHDHIERSLKMAEKAIKKATE